MSSLAGLRPSALPGARSVLRRMPKRLILASASPRRRELLGLLGLPFEVVVSEVDESPNPMPAPRQLARDLAEEKALMGWLDPPRGSDNLAIGADTVVVCDAPGLPVVLAKPAHADDAKRMLALLS